MSVQVISKVDNTSKLKSFAASYDKLGIQIGIPAGSERTDSLVTNGEIGYLFEYGSPARGIPDRPFLVPGIENAMDKVSDIMKEQTDITKVKDMVSQTLVASVKEQIEKQNLVSTGQLLNSIESLND
jgi:hypothetical protein